MKNKKRRYTTKQTKRRIFVIKGLLMSIGVIVIINYAIAGVREVYDYLAYQPVLAVINYPKIEEPIEACEVLDEFKAMTTAYNAGDPNQCDNTPCIASNGENICTALALGYGRCASNKYKFGTMLEVEGYGRCIVVDRMNRRYQNNEIDVAMTADKYKEAIQFGGHLRNIKVLKCEIIN